MVATNVKVFDGVHEELVEGHVVVSGSKIVEVTETMPSTGDDVEVIDGDGRVLMPGLTDAHCHIMGMCHSLPAMMQGDIGWIYANTVAAAERTLTTVRDAGGPVFGIKQAIDLGTIPGPRIYPSGAMISQTAGHGDFSMTYDVATALGGVPTRGDSVGMTLVADGPDRVLAGAREQLKKGATQIKMMVGGGVLLLAFLLLGETTHSTRSSSRWTRSARRSMPPPTGARTYCPTSTTSRGSTAPSMLGSARSSTLTSPTRTRSST